MEPAQSTIPKGRGKGKGCEHRVGLPARACAASLLTALDDKALFAERLFGSKIHPPTVVLQGEDEASLNQALLQAEALFDPSRLWFVKHRTMGGGAGVYCVSGWGEAQSLLRGLQGAQNYVLQEGVRPRLYNGKKFTVRAWGVYFKGNVHFLPTCMLVKVFGKDYTEETTDRRAHIQDQECHRGVFAVSAEDCFAQFRGEKHRGVINDHCIADEIRKAAHEVLNCFRLEAHLVPDGEYCLIGLDFLSAEDGAAICVEANYPCAMFSRAGTTFEVVKARLRHSLRLLLEGSEGSGFEIVEPGGMEMPNSSDARLK